MLSAQQQRDEIPNLITQINQTQKIIQQSFSASVGGLSHWTLMKEHEERREILRAHLYNLVGEQAFFMLLDPSQEHAPHKNDRQQKEYNDMLYPNTRDLERASHDHEHCRVDEGRQQTYTPLERDLPLDLLEQDLSLQEVLQKHGEPFAIAVEHVLDDLAQVQSYLHALTLSTLGKAVPVPQEVTQQLHQASRVCNTITIRTQRTLQPCMEKLQAVVEAQEKKRNV